MLPNCAGDVPPQQTNDSFSHAVSQQSLVLDTLARKANHTWLHRTTTKERNLFIIQLMIISFLQTFQVISWEELSPVADLQWYWQNSQISKCWSQSLNRKNVSVKMFSGFDPYSVMEVQCWIDRSWVRTAVMQNSIVFFPR